jgi:hypothetical protein
VFLSNSVNTVQESSKPSKSTLHVSEQELFSVQFIFRPFTSNWDHFDIRRMFNVRCSFFYQDWRIKEQKVQNCNWIEKVNLRCSHGHLCQFGFAISPLGGPVITDYSRFFSSAAPLPSESQLDQNCTVIKGKMIQKCTVIQLRFNLTCFHSHLCQFKWSENAGYCRFSEYWKLISLKNALHRFVWDCEWLKRALCKLAKR